MTTKTARVPRAKKQPEPDQPIDPNRPSARTEEFTEPPIALQVTDMELDRIEEHPSNPRREWGDLDELAQSIKAVGVLSRVLLRPHPESRGRYQLVAGARRFRAAAIAGLSLIPAEVKNLTDAQVAEIQLIENLQRKDIHALDEAEAMLRLHREHGYSIEDLQQRLGKKRSAIYVALQMARLPEKVKALIGEGEGKMRPAVAMLLCRVADPKMQEVAAAKLVCDRDGQPMSYRDAQHYLQNEVLLQLENAPWKLDDAELVPSAGACSVCPKRTGNQEGLFPDVSPNDMCTDAGCFRSKHAALFQREAAAFKEAGRKVLGAGETKRVFEGPKHHNPDKVRYDSPFVNLDDQHYGPGGYKSWRAILKSAAAKSKGKEDPLSKSVLAQAPGGSAVELYPRALAEAAARKLAPARASSGGPKASAAEKQRLAKQAEKERARRAGVAAVRLACAAHVVKAVGSEDELGKMAEPIWRELAGVALDNIDHECDEAVVALLALPEFGSALPKEKPTKGARSGSAEKRHGTERFLRGREGVERCPVDMLPALVLALETLGTSDYGNARGGTPLDRLCATFKVNRKKVEADAAHARELAAEQKKVEAAVAGAAPSKSKTPKTAKGRKKK